MRAIKDDTLRFQSWFGDDVQAQLPALDAILFSARSYNLLYEGPTGTNGWRIGRNPRSWEYKDGAFIANGADLLGRFRHVVLDFSDVPLVDSTAANALKGFIEKLSRSGTRIYIAGAARPVRRTLLIAGLRKPLIRYVSAVEDAVAQSGAADDPHAPSRK